MKNTALREKMIKLYGSGPVCGPKTEVVIEGYPRSSNSFTVSMLKLMDKNQPRISVAHHTHSSNNLTLGVEYGIPVVVMVRRPEDAILSYLIYSNRPIELLADRYVDFYSAVLKLDTKPVVADFETVISDFNVVIARINEKLSDKSRVFSRSDDLARDAEIVQSDARQRFASKFGASDFSRVGAPSEEREVIKLKRRAEVREYLAQHAEIDALYQEIIALRDR